MKKTLTILILCSLTACASVQPDLSTEKSTEGVIAEALTVSGTQNMKSTHMPEPQVPEFVPVHEGISPLKTKKVTIAARQTPLRDVLYTIAETAHLNVVMERGVDSALPVTMTFEEISVEDALGILFDSMDYFYEVKDNILIVKAMKTEIFEFGQPNIIQEYSISVGGDILSGIATVGSGSGALNGAISMKASSDKESFQLWSTIAQAIPVLLDAKRKREGGLQPHFVINRMTGTIMVTASKKELKKVRDYITTLKKILNRQVLIEARVVEVQVTDGTQYGIDWTAVGEWLGIGTINMGTKGFSSVVSAADPQFEFSVTDNDNLTLILKALKQQGDVQTLSNPRLNIMNGQTSMLSVGRNTSFVSSVETTTTAGEGVPITTFTVETNSILSGLIFGLAPFINEDGEITMTITPITTNLVALESKSIGSVLNQTEIALPTVDLREMTTTVKVLDGQMVIIGGLIDKKQTYNVEKVPIIGDIPFIGKAFTRLKSTYENTELVIMLIPRIVG